MNVLLVGARKTPLLPYIPNDSFLLIDDGPLADEVLKSSRTVRLFDVSTDSFNPLADMTYRKAREFVNVLDAVFPEGENTLTTKRARFQILKALLDNPTYLGGLIKDTKETEDAYQRIETLLLSPVLDRVLNKPSNFSVQGTVVARLDRAKLGDFDAFVLGNLLISQFQGAIAIPDFGFYACPFHTSLFRQRRIIAGVNALDEVPRFKHHLLQADVRIGSKATYDDAAVLAQYEGLVKDTGKFGDFVHAAIS
jgi:hypothetical protein